MPAYDPFWGPRRSNLAKPCSHELVREVLAGPVRYAHFGMPCTTFSAALRGVARLRSVADPVDPRAEHAADNQVAQQDGRFLEH